MDGPMNKFTIDDIILLYRWLDANFSQWFNEAEKTKSEGFLAGGSSMSRQLRASIRKALLKPEIETPSE